jgi:hypothetical protein
MWVVKDSAAIRYEEASLARDGALDTTVAQSRTGVGTVRGVHVLDTELHLFRWREDTTRLQGEAVLRYPDGRSFRTPARYEQTRSWKLFDARTYQTELAERSAERARHMGGMVISPSNAIEQRLAEGDSVVRDSLLREWRRASDPDVAREIFDYLSLWVRGGQSKDAIERFRIAAGDTAFLYEYLTRRHTYRIDSPIDSADVRAMLRFMEDPAIAWAFNLNQGDLYESLAQALMESPRAVPLSDGDSVSCTLAACRLLADQRRSAREPRTRDIALVALFSMDPRQWADTVLAFDAGRHPLLRTARRLALGIASKAPMPPPQSDARSWLEWMSAGTPKLNFEHSHITVIRMYTASTGRDVVSDLRQSYRAATSDSARLIFGSMLGRLGALQLTEPEVAEALASRVPVRVEFAREMLFRGLGWSGTPTADAKIAVLIDQLISAVVNSTPLWPNLMPGRRLPVRDLLPGGHSISGRIYFDIEHVPETVRAKWAGQVEFISKSEWWTRDSRGGGTLYILSPVRAWGRFVQLNVETSERVSRAVDEAPQAYAAGSTYYLMELNGEWVVVSSNSWIT